MLILKEDISVPMCVSGAVQETSIDFCMDGVPFLLITQFNTFRVKPRTREIHQTLLDAVGTRTIVGVCGYLRRGAECAHIDAYWAGSPEELENMTAAKTEVPA